MVGISTVTSSTVVGCVCGVSFFVVVLTVVGDIVVFGNVVVVTTVTGFPEFP